MYPEIPVHLFKIPIEAFNNDASDTASVDDRFSFPAKYASSDLHNMPYSLLQSIVYFQALQ